MPPEVRADVQGRFLTHIVPESGDERRVNLVEVIISQRPAPVIRPGRDQQILGELTGPGEDRAVRRRSGALDPSKISSSATDHVLPSSTGGALRPVATGGISSRLCHCPGGREKRTSSRSTRPGAGSSRPETQVPAVLIDGHAKLCAGRFGTRGSVRCGRCGTHPETP